MAVATGPQNLSFVTCSLVGDDDALATWHAGEKAATLQVAVAITRADNALNFIMIASVN